MRTLALFVLIALLASCSIAETARSPKSHPHELVGFLLRQSRSAFEAELGKPFDCQVRPDGAIGYAYQIPKALHTELTVIYDKDQSATTIELTGADYRGPTGFLGIRLGDLSKSVEAALGKPSSISHEDDVNGDLWDYEDANYSLEFTGDHRLSSIQINDEPGKNPMTVSASINAYQFAISIQEKQVSRIMEMASGEIKCGDKQVFDILNGSARNILSDPKSGVSTCLTRAANIVIALGRGMSATESYVRAWGDHLPGIIVKFPKSSPLDEILFVQEAGEWRVCDIKFR